MIAKTKQPEILKAATGLNFWGKRLAEKKREVAEKVSEMVFNTKSRSGEVFDFLEENQPVKPAKQVTAKRKAVNADLPLEQGQLMQSEKLWPVLDGNCFILTSAQNNTPAHENFLKSLEKYAEFRKAKILCSAYIYNLKGFQSGENEETYFTPSIQPYLQRENVFLNNRSFAFMAAFNILPTASYPLSGLNETIGQYSAVIGHAQISSEAVAAPKGAKVRRLYSTGTVTMMNYRQQKVGQKAEAMHCYGATLVEFDSQGVAYVRQLQAMDESGEFYDLVYKASPDGVQEVSGHVAAINYGDIHAEKLDDDCALASFGTSDSLLDFLKPKYQLVHDVHDFTTRNHHNRNSGLFLAQQYFNGRDKVEDDLKDTGEVLAMMQRDYTQTIVVESNHDLALSRWLDDPKYKPQTDPANAELYFKLNAAQYEAVRTKDDTFNMLDYALRVYSGYEFNAIFLVTDQSFPIAGVETGMHGHTGANGSRGTPKQFKKFGIPLNTGHTHTPSIYGKCYTAGVTGSLDMGYNQGASSWCQTHIITYANGQRTLIDYVNGKFFAL